MATVSSAALPLQRASWLRPKYLLFAFVGLMVAYVLRHNESFLVNAKHPERAHIHPFRWFLLPHAMMGACALLLGPLQFSDRLRQRFTKLHRVLGRFYVAGVFVGAPMGLYIQYFEGRMAARAPSASPPVPMRRCGCLLLRLPCFSFSKAKCSSIASG
jgi:hypothetical protein